MASRKKEKPKEVRKNALRKFRDDHRITLGRADGVERGGDVGVESGVGVARGKTDWDGAVPGCLEQRTDEVPVPGVPARTRYEYVGGHAGWTVGAASIHRSRSNLWPPNAGRVVA